MKFLIDMNLSPTWCPFLEQANARPEEIDYENYTV